MIEPPPAPAADPREPAPRRFLRGLAYPYHGLRHLLAHRELWGWAALPFLLTSWMIFTAGWLAFWHTDDVVRLVWATPEATWAVLGWWAVVIGVGLAFFLTSAVVLWVVGNLLASPLYDVLAGKVEARLLGPSDEPFAWRTVLGDAWMSVRHSLLGLLLYGLSMGLLLLLNLLPVVGSALYAALSTAATVFFLARELMDIPLSRRRLGFFEKIRWMGGHKALLGGLGLATMAMLAVPVVNLLLMPVAVLGGTLLYCHLHQVGQGAAVG